MKFLAGLVAGAALVASAVAQAGIAFTQTPAVAAVGQQYNITWGGGDGVTPVAITLRKGKPQDLQTIATLTSSGTGGSYLWTPSSSLASGTDYALQITQGQSDINYSGPFTVVGGTGSSSISYSGTSTLTSNSTVTSLVSLVGSSIGTGVPVSRNTTFSSQTLTSTTIASATTKRSTTTTATATTTGTSATTAPTGGAAQFASSFVLVLGAVAAIVCVN